MEPHFWQLNIGHIFTAISVLLGLWGFHRTNVKRIERGEARFTAIETKMDMIYDWFRSTWMGEQQHRRRPRKSDEDNE